MTPPVAGRAARGATLAAALLFPVQAAATAAFKIAEPVLARTGQKGVIHANNASRKVSRLAKRIKAMATA